MNANHPNPAELSASLYADAHAAVRAFAQSGAADSAASIAFESTGSELASAVLGFDAAGWPQLIVVDSGLPQDVYAAYDRSTDSIYLSRDFALHAAPTLVLEVLVEELGHAIDNRLNESDSPGDEGAIFAQFVMGHAPGASELAALKAENDHGTVTIDGDAVAVEFASTSVNGAKVGIVYSETTAARYWGGSPMNQMAYSQLFMAAQSQAAMAGVPYDILSEGDLTNLSKLQQYDALIFPSFYNVQSGQAAAIANTLTQAVQSGVSLIASGDFMQRDQNGNDLGSSRLNSLFGLTFQAANTANFSVTANNTHTMLSEYSANEVIQSYTNQFYAAYQAVSGVTPEVIARQTVGSTTYNAVVATAGSGGAKNVHFSTEAMMADNNLLWQAIDYAVNGGTGVTAGLQMSRNASIVASRVDMDQAMNLSDVSPGDRPGIYDVLLPILQQWKAQYNFVGSYYVDIGDGVPANNTTNWTVSGEYYRELLALGNELGSHSLDHPHDTNALTAAEIQAQFQTARTIIEQRMTQILGQTFTVDGAAVPGNPENLPTALEILKYYSYLSGGFSSIGAGYANAFGYLTPAMATADKVYLAPNVSFDFSLVEFQGLTPAQASARWQQEWSKLTSHSDVPILVWPWHDYGAAAWSFDGTTPSRYTTQMFTDFIAAAYAAGAEFVTLADLADRVSSFDDSTLTWSRSGNTVTATVASPDAGSFALDLDNLGTQKIASVSGWYAYDDDSVFLDRDGGTYTITLGSSAADVTRITKLPMRAELVSLSGNGSNLSFSVIGEGTVVIDLANPTGKQLSVSGATVVSLNGELMTLNLGSVGQHDVVVSLNTPHSDTIDFNGDAKTDILWRNTDGTIRTWQIGNGPVNGQVAGGAATSWSIVDAHGDYNGDGKSDILWRHVDGNVAVWLMNGSQLIGQLGGSAGADWRIVDGHGDYNGDGRSDILWRHSDGTVLIWQNGAATADINAGGAQPSWSIISAHGDYNGDGKSDILWRNIDGSVAIWLMDGGRTVGSLSGVMTTSWTIVSAEGDYNGDGKSDILWRNADGTVVQWLGGSSAVSQVAGGAGSVWSIVDALGDYNGDGRSDILWRHANGTVAIWQSGTAAGSYNAGGASPSWTIMDGHADYNGDGKSDILWRNIDGTVSMWLMNGGQNIGSIGGTLPTSWRMPDAAEIGATINGNAASNQLSGTVGRDTLFGLGGNDTLAGGAGADRFAFTTSLSAANNVDTISDFSPGSDSLLLSDVIFASLPRGQLSAGSFVAAVNPVAQDANDHILYATTTGRVLYDSDGTGPAAAVHFATLANQPLLSAQDIYVGLI